MNGKVLLAATLGIITYIVLGLLIYGLLLMDFMESHMVKDIMKEGTGAFIGYIVNSIFFGLLITYVLLKANVKSATGGLMTGGTVTLLFSIGMGAVFYLSINYYTTVTGVIVDTVASIIMGALVGMVIGMVLGREKAPATAETSVA